MNKSRLIQVGLLLLLGLTILVGCAAESNPPVNPAPGMFLATTRGWVTRINREESWFEVKPKGGDGNLFKVNFDATTALLNFKGMIEITKDQPLEVTYKPGGEPVNQAISIRKLLPDECN